MTVWPESGFPFLPVSDGVHIVGSGFYDFLHSPHSLSVFRHYLKPYELEVVVGPSSLLGSSEKGTSTTLEIRVSAMFLSSTPST